ncbi:hypothetical protein TNCV_3763281 [Trichonephila clavipes]|uniref:DUF5641 domain-containing protein n=1 Tax=Trichonephila clavipes TaxID=2585209 RepID=A0A8X7B8E4_TRICX|nr:hypothetical protein TNCV_3763281 [Trichonephila clavipes]
MIVQMLLIKEDFLPINTWPLGRILEEYQASDGKEVETDQAIEEPAEIMHINEDSESKYEKSVKHETFELN